MTYRVVLLVAWLAVVSSRALAEEPPSVYLGERNTPELLREAITPASRQELIWQINLEAARLNWLRRQAGKLRAEQLAVRSAARDHRELTDELISGAKVNAATLIQEAIKGVGLPAGAAQVIDFSMNFGKAVVQGNALASSTNADQQQELAAETLTSFLEMVLADPDHRLAGPQKVRVVRAINVTLALDKLHKR